LSFKIARLAGLKIDYTGYDVTLSNLLNK